MTKMKKIIPITIVMLIMLFMTGTAFAACDNACDSATQYSCSLSTTSMWKNSKGTLTVAVTNQQSQAQSATATLLGNWFIGDVTSIAGNTYNQGQAKTLDFSVTPSNDGSQPVCVRMGTTCSADCGLITISSNAELSVTTLTTSATSVAPSGTFTTSATIQNSGTQTAGSTTSITATLSSNAYCTVSSGAKTVGTIAGKSTTSQSWTVTAGSSTGTCTLTLSVSGTPGGSASNTASVTIATTTTEEEAAGGGGGGGGAGGAASTTVKYYKNKAKIKIPSIAANKTEVIKLRNMTESDVKNITIIVRNKVKDIEINILKLEGKPAVVTKEVSGKVYRYMQINKENITDNNISSVKINFFVENSWITDNNIDDTTVSLNRYANDAWAKLSTTKTGKDATYTYYEADSPGLSVFAITAEEIAAPTPTEAVCGNGVCETGETYDNCAADCPKPAACGDGVIEGNEECEGSNVEGQTCASRGYAGGALKCTNCRIDESKCIMQTPIGEISKETMDLSIIIIAAILVVVLIAGWFYYHGHKKTRL